MHNKCKNIAVLGGGLSGLSVAWHLKQKFGSQVNITIIEKSDRWGGWISTVQQENFLFEQGPRGCRPKGSGLATLHLAQQLGLQNQLIASNAEAKKRYVYSQGKLQLLPTHPIKWLFSSLVRRALIGGLRDLLCKPATDEDVSIEAFCHAHFGKFVTENLINPMVLGIYAGDISTLSMQSCFPSLYRAAAQHGSVLKGLYRNRKQNKEPIEDLAEECQAMLHSPLFSFKEGMSTLTEALLQKTEAHKILGAAAQQIISKENGMEIALPQQTLLFDHVVAALPACALASLLPMQHQKLIKLLQSIEYASVAVVQLGYHAAVLKQTGFGYLVPSNEQEEILGVVFDSSIFPEQNGNQLHQTRLTVMCRIDAPCDDESILQKSLHALKKHLSLSYEPDYSNVFFAWNAIPQYTVGHMQKLKEIRTFLHTDLPHLHILGNSYYGVSVNDCIAQAKHFAAEFIF